MYTHTAGCSLAETASKHNICPVRHRCDTQVRQVVVSGLQYMSPMCPHSQAAMLTQTDAVVMTALQPVCLNRCSTTCRLQLRLFSLRVVPAVLAEPACQSRLYLSMPAQPPRQDVGSAAPAWWTASMDSLSSPISLWLWRVCMQLRV